MRIDELIEKLKEKERKDAILTVYRELKSDLRQTLILMYGVPALVSTLAALLKGTLFLPLALSIVLLLSLLLFMRHSKLERLLERVGEILTESDPMDEETKRWLKENWLLILYTILGYVVAIIIALSP